MCIFEKNRTKCINQIKWLFIAHSHYFDVTRDQCKIDKHDQRKYFFSFFTNVPLQGL